MALTAQHIKNIDLFLNSKNIMPVEVTETKTGVTRKFTSRAAFIQAVKAEKSISTSLTSLTGMLIYRILTNREFFGYIIKLIENENGNTRGNTGKSLSGTVPQKKRALRTCLLGESSDHCKGKNLKRHVAPVFLVNAKTGDLTEFKTIKEYTVYATTNNLLRSINRQKIRGKMKVGESLFLIPSKDYLNRNIMKTYYWVKGSNGKFIKGCESFNDLCKFLREPNLNKVRSAIANGSVIRGKRIVMKREIDTSKLKDDTK